MVRFLSEGATSTGHVHRLFTTPELLENNGSESVLLISQGRSFLYHSRSYAVADRRRVTGCIVTFGRIPLLMYCWIKHTWSYYILGHLVVRDWMAVACEHHRAKRKLQFEMSQQLTLCGHDLDDSGAHRATKRSYRANHSLRRISTTSTWESMNNLAVLSLLLVLRRSVAHVSHFFK